MLVNIKIVDGYLDIIHENKTLYSCYLLDVNTVVDYKNKKIKLYINGVLLLSDSIFNLLDKDNNILFFDSDTAIDIKNKLLTLGLL